MILVFLKTSGCAAESCYSKEPNTHEENYFRSNIPQL